MQAVAGQMLAFFAEIGCQFPQFPFIAHSRGSSAEDMENNQSYVQRSQSLHQGAAALARRCAAMAKVMIEEKHHTQTDPAGNLPLVYSGAIGAH